MEQVLFICGSLRRGSSNHAILSAVENLLKHRMSFSHVEIGQLPYFQPELQFSDDTPNIVKKMRTVASQSKYIVIATPEYAHGIPGALKNCLEWLLCEETMKKRALVFIGAPSGGLFAQEQIVETLKTMDFLITKEDTLIISNARQAIDAEGSFKDERCKKEMDQFLNTRMLSY